MSTQPRCGLFTGEAAVPLAGVCIEARLSGACVEVTVTQRFINREQVPVEAVYVFPLDEAAAVCGFAALVGERLIRGKSLERERAFAEYDDAMHAGDGGFLLEQERPNVFTASVGNLRPGETVELQLRYVSLAAREGDALRLAIPTTVSPRYVPQPARELGQPAGERVNPEHWPAVPYGLTLSVTVEGDKLCRVESPSHPVRTTLQEGSIQVELAQEEAALDRDFVLLVESREPHQPSARVAREPDGQRVVLLTFLPKDLGASEQGHEVLFLLDCSGSMAGDSIAQAKRALSLCVRALAGGDTFNVICFGSTHTALWPKARRFDESSLEEATRYVAAIEANLGGTEILAPLKDLLESPRDPERPRRVLVLTDGQVSNEAEVIALAQAHANGARIFSFGIGAGASEHLVRGVSRASRGASEMIFPGERIEPKVLRTFARVRTPVLDDVRVEYGGLEVEQAPRRTPPVFAGDALTVLARIERGSASAVELVAGGQRFRVPIDLERGETAGPIPTLWARERLRELEEGSGGGSQQKRPDHEERQKARIVELATRYGLMSSETSFVAVEERSADDKTREQPQLRRIPVALTHGWGGEASHGTGSRGGALAGVAFSAGVPPAIGGFVTAAPAPRARPAPAPMAKGGGGFLGGIKRALSRAGEPEGAAQEGFRGQVMRESRGEKREATDRLFELLMTQRADGSFERSPVLDAWLGGDRVWRLINACKQHEARVVATSVVLLLLERDEPTRESEWRPALTKAKAWLAKQTATFDARAIL
jgi:Ca-activated chloride channel family protein